MCELNSKENTAQVPLRPRCEQFHFRNNQFLRKIKVQKKPGKTLFVSFESLLFEERGHLFSPLEASLSLSTERKEGRKEEKGHCRPP